MIKTHALIINKLGLHARAASKLVTTASSFASIKIGRKEQMADAKSIMSVMMLAACKGTKLFLEVEGHDQDQACKAVIDLINRRFDEEE
jgi:phosphocarrier protein HPr